MKKMPSGTYQIAIYIPKERNIKIGSLGGFNIKKGYYIYTGRAKRNLFKRVERYLHKKGKKRWHIDYLVKYGSIVDIRFFYQREDDECKINQDTLKELGGEFLIPGFGSSDCHCKSHLIYTKDKIWAQLNKPV